MKQVKWMPSAAALSMVLLTIAGSAAAGSETQKGMKMAASQVTQEQDIVATAVAAGSFKTLAAALQAAGLVETLQSKGPFTVFAPTDEAFAKLPKGTVEELLEPKNKEKLTSVLTYHVVAGSVMGKDVIGLKSAKTLNGQSLSVLVKDGAVSIDGANVVKTDIACSNGVIHVIDSVVLPK